QDAQGNDAGIAWAADRSEGVRNIRAFAGREPRAETLHCRGSVPTRIQAAALGRSATVGPARPATVQMERRVLLLLGVRRVLGRSRPPERRSTGETVHAKRGDRVHALSAQAQVFASFSKPSR